jgi:TP901 family phage tail tape measure protein
MGTLETAGKLAVAGLGTTEEATDLLTSAMNAFESQGYSAEETAEFLFKTVKAGKTTVAELAQSFGIAAPIIASAGIDLKEFQAATAALTTTGLTASVAQNQLRQATVSLIKPTTEMKDLLEEVGAKSGKELIETAGGLVPALEKLEEATAGDNEQWAKALGSVEALNAATGLLGEQNKAYTETMKAMEGEIVELDEAFQKQMGTFDAQYAILKGKVNKTMIELGNVIIPHLINAMNYLLETIIPWVQKHWPDIQAGGRAVGKVFKALASVIRFLSSIWEEVFYKIFRITDTLAKVVGRVVYFVVYHFHRIRAAFRSLKASIRSALSGIWEAITSPFRRAFNWIRGQVDAVAGVFSRISGAAGGAISRVKGILGFQTGGIVPSTGMYQLHKGEYVAPAGGHTAGGQTTINFYGNVNLSSNQNIREVARQLARQLELARQGGY